MDNQTFKYKITERASGYTESVRSFDELKFVHILNGSGIWNVNGRDLHVSIDDILIFSKNDERYIKSVTSKEPFPSRFTPFRDVRIFSFIKASTAQVFSSRETILFTPHCLRILPVYVPNMPPITLGKRSM